MKTKPATALCDHILEEANRLSDTAAMYAVQYANDDKPENKAIFAKYSFASEEVRKLHAAACQALHELERMIPNEEPRHE